MDGAIITPSAMRGTLYHGLPQSQLNNLNLESCYRAKPICFGETRPLAISSAINPPEPKRMETSYIAGNWTSSVYLTFQTAIWFKCKCKVDGTK